MSHPVALRHTYHSQASPESVCLHTLLFDTRSQEPAIINQKTYSWRKERPYNHKKTQQPLLSPKINWSSAWGRGSGKPSYYCHQASSRLPETYQNKKREKTKSQPAIIWLKLVLNWFLRSIFGSEIWIKTLRWYYVFWVFHFLQIFLGSVVEASMGESRKLLLLDIIF